MSLLADPGDFLNLSVLSGSEAEIRKSETFRIRVICDKRIEGFVGERLQAYVFINFIPRA